MGLNTDNTTSPIKFTPGKDSSYSSSSSSAPSGATGSQKDFKKVLDKSDDDDSGEGQSKITSEEDEAEVSEAVAKMGKVKKPPSIFGLKSSKPVKQSLAKQENVDEDGVDSPNVLFAKLSAGEGKKGAKGFMDESDEEAPALLDIPEKKQFTTRFSTEQSDLSNVNPLATTVNTQVGTDAALKPEKSVMPASNIQEIINQMVAQVNEIKQDGRTETIVTLKQPPLFAGADIVVTAFDSAKGEFNISFENLTQAAKNVLDMQVNKDSLLLALEQKGYNVHIITVTTLSENRPVNQEGQSGGQRDEDARRGQGQPRQQGRQGSEDQT